jgi:signal transduction histidine kinase
MLVDDDGDGIPESERQAVFEPFYRLEASRSRNTGGSGLGLAIAKQITEAHGGLIDIETSPMGGARFRVTLPIEAQMPPSG